MVGALALVLTSFAGTAGATPPAQDGTIHQTLPIPADDFQQEGDCGGIAEGTAWHFILNNTTVDTAGSTLTAMFEDAGTVTVPVHEITGGATHYYVGTADGDVLTGASVSTGDGQLQLSHVCDAPDVGDDEETPATELVCPADMVPPVGEELEDRDGDGVYADNCVEVEDDDAGDDAEVGASLECGVLTATSTKDISNLVVEFADGSTEKLDGLSGLEYEVDLDELFPGREVVAVYVKSGDNGTQGTGEKVLVTDSGTDCEQDAADLVCPAGMVPPVGGELEDRDGDGVYADNCVDSTVVVDVPRGDTGGETPVVTETPATEVESEDVVNTPTAPIPTVTPASGETPVLGETPAPAAVPDAASVLGDTVTRSAGASQLPRTGPEAGLIPIGLALLLAGVAFERAATRAGQRA